MRASPEESLIQNLEARWPEGSLYFLPKEQALEQLKLITGVDYGYDSAAWRSWQQSRRKLRSRADGAKRSPKKK